MCIFVLFCCVVLLGVMDQDVSDRIFQAKMERRLALLLGEGLSAGRRLKRATSVGNNSVQVTDHKSPSTTSLYSLLMLSFLWGKR